MPFATPSLGTATRGALILDENPHGTELCPPLHPDPVMCYWERYTRLYFSEILAQRGLFFSEGQKRRSGSGGRGGGVRTGRSRGRGNGRGCIV